ncbi:PrgI family protein [Candidatus Saccharibacteria bacterium]|nr:PrgI family protein [Candidatus Saccharibacteria bacterium]
MKTTVVPAQVTTVEDKIAGNLTFSQLLLLTTPVFLTGAIFAFLPPFMNLRGYKFTICVVITVACMSLAIRIKGRIALSWIAVLGKYNLRPRHYIYDKNSTYLQEDAKEEVRRTEEKVSAKESRVHEPIEIPMNKLVWAEEVASDPRAKLEFKTTKKGDLRVYIQEVK